MALRKRNAAEDEQATLDFGGAEETTSETSETTESPVQNEEKEEIEESGSEEQSESSAEGDASDSSKVVVKRRRVVKKAEEGETPAQSGEDRQNNNNHRYQNNQNKFNNNNRRGQGGMRKPYGRNSYTPPSAEVAEMMAAEAAAAAEENANKPRLLINDLTIKSMPELRELAMNYGFTADDLAPMKKQDLIFVILKAHTEHGGIIFASGSLEILPDGYGFLRSPQNSYLPGPDDIYISPSQIRLFNLKTGDTVYGQTRSPKEGERFFALLRIETVMKSFVLKLYLLKFQHVS